MDNTATFNGMQPTLNPSWKEALDKAMHQSLMRGRSVGAERGEGGGKGGKTKQRDDDESVTLSENDTDTRDDDDDLSSTDEDDDSVSESRPAPLDERAPPIYSRPLPAAAAAPAAKASKVPPSVVFANPGESAASVKARLEQNRNLQREEKMELLGRLHYFMDEKGFRPFKVLGPEDSLEDIRYEVFRAQRELSKRRNVKFMQKALVSVGAGLEMANSMYNPLGLRLDGFSKSLLLSIKDYDEILEELHFKYCDAVSMPPELRLVMTLGSSIFFYHLSNNGPSRPSTGGGGVPMSPPRMPMPSQQAPPSQPAGPSMQQRKMAGPRSRMNGDASSSGSGGSGPNVDMSTLMSGLSMVNTLMNNNS